MSKNKNAVKRPKGMSQPPNYVDRLYRDNVVAAQTGLFYGKAHTEEELIIALGRLGWREKRLRRFSDILDTVRHDYKNLDDEDAATGKYLGEAKAYFDKELFTYLGMENMVPWEDRYDPAIQTWGIRALDLKKRMEEAEHENKK